MSRTWIIQEAAVNSATWFMFGGSYTIWADMMVAVHCLSWLMTSQDAQSTRETLALRFILPDSARSIETLGFIQSIRRSEHEKPIWELLSRLRLTKATDPRDKIYGLYGIAKDRESLPLPDYTKPVETIYTEFVTHSVTTSGPAALSFLLPEAGLYQQSGALRLPLWVPEWSNLVILGVDLSLKYWLEGSILRTGPRDHRAINWRFDINAITGSLTIPGVSRHSIISLTEEIVGGQSAWQLPLLFDQRCRPLMATAASIMKSEPVSEDEAYIALFDRLANTVTCNMYMNAPPSELRSTQFNQAGIAYTALLQEAQLKSQEEDIDPGGMLEMQDQPEYNIIRFISARRLCLTSSGLFGLVPMCTKLGDQLVVFENHATYFVVRPCGKEHVLVGPAFVEDIDRVWDDGADIIPAIDITIV